ncbi:LPS export ABC transporter permease LptF [Nitrospirillum amazonense]|uniref:Lipopolysaccharide export system permease protein LptF n=1 Tax=Nitrospirillum amazonense TaxID=28077 RepID=A0A560J047_9PROT|nr:LPS export ABC transporter permease LptF [Nitrospirillum amazonense]MDG3439140.1 LPS export ABC transporter permease LptF [Nitrospirillum amazonense]TWB64457.1 lipopolysaccharide export system permease protein [Nitrospirillum amazonense]
MIIERYLIREVAKPLAAVLGILAALFVGYSTAGLLADAVNGLLPTGAIAELVGLKLLISLEVLIPISLYVSVVMAFGKLYGDSEITAMFALHVSPGIVLRALFMLSGGLAVLVLALSLFVRPWAYEKSHDITYRAQLSMNVDAMESGTFYLNKHGGRVIFFPRREGIRGPAKEVFIQIQHPTTTDIIMAQSAHALPPKRDGGSNVQLDGAHVYFLGRDDSTQDRMMDVGSVTLDPANHNIAPQEYSATGVSSARLARSSDPADIAEFQWRLSTCLSTLLLGLLGMPLSRVNPRQGGRYAKFGTAILVYSGYYLLCTSARTWVQHGSVGAIPGIWWAPALLAVLLVVALYWPQWNVEFRVRALVKRLSGSLEVPREHTVRHDPV